MKRFIILILCLSALQAEAKLRPQKDGEYDVFLCIGQSNMAGRGNMEPGDTAVIPGVFILNDRDEIEPARAPLNRYSTVRKKIRMQQICPADEFSRLLAERTGRRILLVVNARGGSSIERWGKGAEPYIYNNKEWDNPDDYGKPVSLPYVEAVRRTRVAMDHGKLRGIIWHQGESDAGRTPEYYKERLSILVKGLRRELGVGRKVPFVVGETGRKFKDCDKINPTLNEVSKYVPNSCCVSSEGCEMNPDDVHFSREGQRLLGSRYADAILKAVYRK